MLMPTIQIKPWEKNDRLGQIYRTGIEYAFVSAAGEQCHQWVLCKDFLQDALWAQINQAKATIFGFNFNFKDGANPPVDLECLRLAISCNAEKRPLLRKWAENSCALINCVEKDLGFGNQVSTLAEASTSRKDIMVFIGPSAWLAHPGLLSFYSFLLRAGMNYDSDRPWKDYLGGKDLVPPNGFNGNDADYAAWGADFWKSLNTDLLQQLGTDMRKNWPAANSISTTHNNGFLHFSWIMKAEKERKISNVTEI